MIPESIDDNSTEGDVETLLVQPILNEILSYSDTEIRSKTQIDPTDIDKGAGKRRGYYPDYLIYLCGLPLIAVEAKSPQNSTEEGYREARLYATELNKRFPAAVNPTLFVLSTNGSTIMFGPWDSEEESVSATLGELAEGCAARTNIAAMMSKAVLTPVAIEMRSRLTPHHRHVPLRLLGGHARQQETVVPNSFAEQLGPLLRKFFDPDETNDSDEVIQKGYCSSDELTQHNRVLESLLKERIPSNEAFSRVETTKKRAQSMDDALQGALEQKDDIPDPLILLVGSVGSGKSMFIHRYRRHLMPEHIGNHTIWVYINFNDAPSALQDAEEWICNAFISSYAKDHGGEDAFSYENLCKYFSPLIASRKAGIYKPLVASDPDEFNRRLVDDMQKWTDDPKTLAEGIIRFHSKDSRTPVVVIFDNVDKRDRDQQLQIFQSVQWFRHKNKCFSILSLRDETFDAYKNEPPLDAFLKPFAFRITPPRFNNVVKKRLELAIAHLSKGAPETQTFQIAGGAEIEYPTSNLGRYLLSIYKSIFHPQRRVRSVLEALTGRNVRQALEMFTSILMSGYLSEQKLLAIGEGSDLQFQEWLIIRILMRTNHRYYTEDNGYISNIFNYPEGLATGNNFLIGSILDFLAENRKARTDFRLEGYFLASQVADALRPLGYSYEDVLSGLGHALG